MAQKQLSMKEIAQLAGVSVATVSHVVNNVGRFSEDTRKRVQDVIDQYGYVTNQSAKTLRQAQSRSIGMIVPDISNDFFSKIAYHVERTLAAQGYSVFVCNSGNDPQRERDYFHSLAGKQADGIICISGLRELTDDIVTRGIPVVCIDRMPQSDLAIPHVGTDDERGAYLATSALIDRDCKNILTISSFTADYDRNDRLTGYMHAVADHGLPLRREYMVYVTGQRPSMNEAQDIVAGLIDAGMPLDGIFATSDHSAAGALRAVQAAGLNVPGDIKIVGYDDSIYSKLTTPQITTVQRHPELMAQEGCKALLDLIAGRTPAMETVVPVELVRRRSC